MIDKQEIMDFAREFSLPVNTIEKDYVKNNLLFKTSQILRYTHI